MFELLVVEIGTEIISDTHWWLLFFSEHIHGKPFLQNAAGGKHRSMHS